MKDREIPGFLNSASFEFAFKTKDLREIDFSPVLISEYKMYTDADGIYLYTLFTSPTHLLNVAALHEVKHVALSFLDENSKVISGYTFETLGYSWEFEGNKAEAKGLAWQVIFAIKRETIAISKTKDEPAK